MTIKKEFKESFFVPFYTAFDYEKKRAFVADYGWPDYSYGIHYGGIRLFDDQLNEMKMTNSSMGEFFKHILRVCFNSETSTLSAIALPDMSKVYFFKVIGY